MFLGGHNLLDKVLLLLLSVILTFGQITRPIGFSSVKEESSSFTCIIIANSLYYLLKS